MLKLVRPNISSETSHYCVNEAFTAKLQGVFFQSASGTGLFQALIWALRGPQRLQCTPKIGRKLLLGKKHTVLGFRDSQEASCLREFQDFLNLALFSVCLKK